MNTLNPSLYWQGFRAGIPFIIVVGPFGVVATEVGLDTIQTMAMTILVIAGLIEKFHERPLSISITCIFQMPLS